MNTALVGAGHVTVRPIGHSTLLQRISRRAGLALVAWSRGAEQRHSREELAELHERRQEAERLREERFRNVAMARMI
ncbi:hypothetical protein EV187_1092 [Agromyces ramosus]|uniref:Uncharacterized protein n=1 Tax=Agromyces ramosus TaxID=33879 RepID=A0A4Q7MMB8_9MICO|nr:hypothetical protein [Agromyces ramosus]RZS68658.1 hypothetical protein EV187_1092 [Agromyces ramosus]